MSAGKACSFATPRPAVKLSPRKRIVPPKANATGVRQTARQTSARFRRAKFLMRDESTSGKQSAPLPSVNEADPNPGARPPNEKLSDRRGPPHGLEKRFLHARAGSDVLDPWAIWQRQDDFARTRRRA